MKAAAKYMTLSLLQQEVQRSIDAAFPLPVWVVAEISEIKVNASGHCYLSLIERDESVNRTTPKAEVRATIWRTLFAVVRRRFEEGAGLMLSAGLKILFHATVSYHPLYGLSLNIDDIDPAYTLGEAEQRRQATIAQLKADGVWDMNRELPLPLLPQRVAVITSRTAAGWQDFRRELDVSPYRVDVTLFAATMQGDGAAESICQALEQICNRSDEFDLIVIVRGGGSATDLGCFDDYATASMVAQMPLAVVSGIGHDKDTSIVDMVSAVALKTPTAVAQWIVARIAEQDERLAAALRSLLAVLQRTFSDSAVRLAELQALVVQGGRRRCDAERLRCDHLRQRLEAAVGERIAYAQQQCKHYAAVVEAFSLERILASGFAVARCKTKLLRRAADVEVGDVVDISLMEGGLRTKVIEKFERYDKE